MYHNHIFPDITNSSILQCTVPCHNATLRETLSKKQELIITSLFKQSIITSSFSLSSTLPLVSVLLVHGDLAAAACPHGYCSPHRLCHVHNRQQMSGSHVTFALSFFAVSESFSPTRHLREGSKLLREESLLHSYSVRSDL